MKQVITRFVREQKRYSRNDLKNIFDLEINKIDSFIKKLKVFGILKIVKNNSRQKELSDLVDVEIEIEKSGFENDLYLYVFTYVGIIIVESRIIKCYPKYILKNDTPIEEMKQILKVIQKYGAKEQKIKQYNGYDVGKEFNLLPMILFLINDYYEYGIYNNTEDVIEINGEGTILWDKTINNSIAFINNNHPYYMELYTQKTVNNEIDFFKALHECILTKCFKQLEATNLLDLFEISSIEFSNEMIEELGDKEYILQKIEDELNIQFDSRKQILLKTLYAYINYGKILENSDGISFYGTNSFNLVWEKVCSEVFKNNINTKLGELPVKLSKRYDSSIKLIDIIEKPAWIGYNSVDLKFEKKSKDTLIPDIITIAKSDGKIEFTILDAKYYSIELEENRKLANYPGIEDITKQYLYQLAYNKFISDHKISEVKNYFLMPSEGDEFVKKGIVKMDILKGIGLQDIKIRLLPAKEMYKQYLAKKNFDIKILEL